MLRFGWLSIALAALVATSAFAQQEPPAAAEDQAPPAADEPAAAPETPAPAATVESLQSELDALQQQIAAASAEPIEGVAPELAELRTKRVTALQELENVLQRRITSLKRADEVQKSIADFEQQRQAFESTGLEAKPPYKLGFLDQLRDELEGVKREAESDASALETQTASVDTAKRRFQDTEKQRRSIRDEIDALASDADRTAPELRLAIAQTEQDIAEKELSQAEAQRDITEKLQQLNEQRTQLLERKVAFVRDNVIFTQKELQEQLDELQARQGKLDRELREARRTDAANQTRLEDARDALKSARGEENIGKATEALAAREAWAQASSGAVELLQERIDNLAKGRGLWERRLALAQGAGEEELATWEKETSNLLDEFRRRREDLERRLQDLRLTKAEIDNRLSAPDTPDPIKAELDSRMKAIEKREEQANAYLAGLIGVERLAQRLLTDVQEERRVDTWRETWSRFVYTAKQFWERELFVIEDRSFRTGPLVRAAFFFLLVLALTLATRRILNRTVIRHLRETAHQTESILDDVLLAITKSTRALFVVAIGLYIAFKSLPLSPRLEGWLDAFAVIAVVYQAATWGTVALQRAVERIQKRRVAEDPSSVSTFGLMSFFGRVAIWTVALLIALQNLGFEITAVIAGLGVGGIAVAFALQNILGDIFCSIAILLDKPFVVGDFIIVGELMGTVEHIGIKTTRLRSLGGEQIVFSNADLIGSRIRNYKRMYERRVLFAFGVVYETPADQLEEIPGIVKQIVEGIDQTRFDRAHFKDYGDFSLNFEVVYYVLVPDYNAYMDIQQKINLAIYREFEKRGIGFAYPTQEIIVRPNGQSKTASQPTMT